MAPPPPLQLRQPTCQPLRQCTSCLRIRFLSGSDLSVTPCPSHLSECHSNNNHLPPPSHSFSSSAFDFYNSGGYFTDEVKEGTESDGRRISFENDLDGYSCDSE
ncbi:hypothetical protein TB2_002749 [Malus domestica]